MREHQAFVMSLQPHEGHYQMTPEQAAFNANAVLTEQQDQASHMSLQQCVSTKLLL